MDILISEYLMCFWQNSLLIKGKYKLTGIPSKESLKLLQNINKKDVDNKLKSLGLSQDRIDLFFDILTGKQDLKYPSSYDVHRFALKTFFPEQYKAMSLGDHLYSKSRLYEYDPPKNGNNLLKHGISFQETISYAENFGSLIVSFIYKNSEERSIVFSRLHLNNHNKLELPLASFRNETNLYTLSVIQSKDTGFRFISSRIMSKNDYRNTMNQSFKDIYKENPEAKSAFLNRCIEIVETNLFK